MSVLIPLLIAAAVAAAIAKAAADAKRGIDESNAYAGNAGAGPQPTGGLPGLQQTTSDMPTGITNPNAFAPPVSAPGQWTLNPFTVSGGAGANMPSLGMGGADLGPLGTNLPPLQQNLSSVSGPQNHLTISGGQGLMNPFGTTASQPPPAPMPMPQAGGPQPGGPNVATPPPSVAEPSLLNQFQSRWGIY